MLTNNGQNGEEKTGGNGRSFVSDNNDMCKSTPGVATIYPVPYNLMVK